MDEDFDLSTVTLLHAMKVVPERNFRQTLQIEITVPKGTTIDMLPLIFTRDQVEIVRVLSKVCRLVKRQVRNDQEIWLLRYDGTTIFYPCTISEGGKNRFFLRGRGLDPGKEINVKVIAGMWSTSFSSKIGAAVDNC